MPVHGYKPQSKGAVDTVNVMKEMEERVLRLLDDLQLSGELPIDGRWLAIGRTHIQQGFMAVARSVFQPARVILPEDITPNQEN